MTGLTRSPHPGPPSTKTSILKPPVATTISCGHISLDTWCFLLSPQIIRECPSNLQPLSRRFSNEKPPQDVYALLLIGIACLLGA